MKKRIVCITDCTDIAYSELRGTILSELEKVGMAEEVEIEPVVPVQAFSIINGSFVMRLMAEAYPEGTIFLVIVNPVMKRPARLIGRTKKKSFCFIGANTGLFDWFLKDFGVEELYELHDPGFVPFGGKFVHAPAAARIASGISLDTLGKPFKETDLLRLDSPDGTIVHIDNFGLIKFSTQLPDFEEGSRLSVECAGQTVSAVYSRRMMSRETGEWVVYPGSSLGLPELGKVRGHGASEIQAKVGDVVKIVPL